MADRSGKLNVPHTLTANLASRDFNATALAHDALVLDLLVTTTGTLPVLDWSENLLAEQAISLWFKGSVVNGLRLLDFSMRP